MSKGKELMAEAAGPQPQQERDLEIRNLWIDIGEGSNAVHAVRGVDIHVRSGTRLGVVGESGSGKTMTALAVVRVLPPQAHVLKGEILLGGTNLLQLTERAMSSVQGRAISVVFQNARSALNPVFPVGEQIATVYRRHLGGTRKAAWTRAVEMLRSMGISNAGERAHAFPHELSGGMAQRVMIAMALVCEPAVLLADEPTTGLDVTIQAQVLDVIADSLARRSTSLVLISHDIGVVRDMCEDLIVMYAGEVVESGPMATILATPRHPYTRRLIASFAASGKPHYIPGRVPSLRRVFQGCSFVDRCPLADEVCHEIRPELRRLPDGRLVACHKAEEDDVL
jgi:oligopeptide/dipeptide ABC transporter ATP-binding protein